MYTAHNRTVEYAVSGRDGGGGGMKWLKFSATYNMCVWIRIHGGQDVSA